MVAALSLPDVELLEEDDDQELEHARRVDGILVMARALSMVAFRRVKAARRDLDLAVIELEQAQERAWLARGRLLEACFDAENAGRMVAQASALRRRA